MQASSLKPVDSGNVAQTQSLLPQPSQLTSGLHKGLFVLHTLFFFFANGMMLGVDIDLDICLLLSDHNTHRNGVMLVLEMFVSNIEKPF